MTCPDCARAVIRPDTGIANVRCANCCARVIESLRPHRELQDRAFAAWERVAGYVGRDAVIHQLAVRAQMRAMAPLKEEA